MSNNPASFSFPPPPPPPPRISENTDSRGGFRHFSDSGGRGQFNGNQRGSFSSSRARGFGRGRGNGHFASHRAPVETHATQPSQSQRYTSKRSYGDAFNHKPQSRPQPPPTVPSFNASLQKVLSPQSAPPNATIGVQVAKKSNLLGLTPAQEGSASEDDGDEEARMVAAGAQGELQFEYKGHVSTLRTPAEIKAWIAERRKRFPTQAKREAAQKEAAEKRQRYEEQKKKKQDARKQMMAERDAAKGASKTQRSVGKDKANHSTNPSDPITQAQTRADKLQRKLEKAKRDLAAAEAAISGVSATGLTSSHHDTSDANSIDSESGLSSTLDSDATSSSGSDSDTDSAPEETSSRRPLPAIRHGPSAVQPSPQQVCTYFAKNGQCKYGKRCKYVHVQSGSKSVAPKTSHGGSLSTRKGLWQVMVEKEQEEEQRRVLRAIIALGEAGMLEDSKS